MSQRYPFSAIVGQGSMKLGLVLNAINPRIGGVLIRGQKGTAKSTAVRGLAALLPPVDVVRGCRFRCEPRAGAPRCPECATRGNPIDADEQPAELVELPVGATEDRVIGSLDLERALVDGGRHFEPGLLARANRGLLYVDEVNLLPDHLVDALLDAAAMGINTVERDGVSFTHAAVFVLVGTMNPEEGDLRPQLLDRFGLAVDVEGMSSASERAEVVRRRIAFETDPAPFVSRWQAEESAERARIEVARSLLPRVLLDDSLLDLIARICTAFEVDGLRADIVMYKTAATLAAYAGREAVTIDDIRRAAELALPHRRRRQPFDQPGLDRDRLDEIVDNFRAETPDDEPPDSPPPPFRRDTETPPQLPSDGSNNGAVVPEPPQQVFDVAVAPDLHLPAQQPLRSRGGSAHTVARRRRSSVAGTRGRHVRSSPVRAGAVDVLATLIAAVPRQFGTRRDAASQRVAVTFADLRFKVREMPAEALTVFVVDASGSMAARRRMALAKGAVMNLLLQAYQTREEVALIAFRGECADVLLPPTNSVHLATTRLRELPTGGRTPLAMALRRAAALFAQRAAGRTAIRTKRLVLVSDGRANVAPAGGDAFAEALAEARLVRSAGVDAVVVDTEDGPVRLKRASALAGELGATYVQLAEHRS